MKWSVTAAKQFDRCQRPWFYKKIMADGKVKRDPLRIEATRLGRLKTVHAWRGLVVDHVISDLVIPALNQKLVPERERVISVAQSVFDKQLELACKPIGTGRKIEIGLLDMETKGFVDDAQITQAWEETTTALDNFLINDVLISSLLSADYLVPQRGLTFKVGDFSVRGFPDLIAFRHNAPP